MEQTTPGVPNQEARHVTIVTQYHDVVQHVYDGYAILELSDATAGRLIKNAIEAAIKAGISDASVADWLRKGSYGGG